MLHFGTLRIRVQHKIKIFKRCIIFTKTARTILHFCPQISGGPEQVTLYDWPYRAL